MRRSYGVSILFGLAISIYVLPQPVAALPTMIRLGYTSCGSCHISPQGGGLLNAYGRGIDQAQSLRGGEYKTSKNSWIRFLSWDGRITQDLRFVTQEQFTSTTAKGGTQLLRTRIMYRNATELGAGLRFSATVTGENQSARRPAFSYDLPVRSHPLFLNTALLSYRPTSNLEIAFGRDQLPTGINIPDLAVFVRSRNRVGYYDSPTQIKAFWWGKRYFVSPYAFGPGGSEQHGDDEFGGGSLAEFDLLGKQRTIVGLNFLRGSSRNCERNLVAPYARIGFGNWGILAEHDFTNRTSNLGLFPSFRQSATYGQLFYYPREWLVASLIGERLRVDAPFKQQRNAGKLEISARLASQLTIGLSARLQRDPLSGRTDKTLAFSLALKSVF